MYIRMCASPVRPRTSRTDRLCIGIGRFIGDKIAAVVDGVTSHGKLLWHGGSSGWFAKEVLCEYLRLHKDELAEMPVAECMVRLNRVLAERGREVHPEIYEGVPAEGRMGDV